jgi:DNA-binding IclR family transcriptional regulator
MSTPSNDNGTVNRVLRILSCFGEKDAWGLNELARALALPRASAHRLLNLCKPLNYVAQNDAGHYVAGVELLRIAGKLAADMPIQRLAQPIIESIRDSTDETTLLALLVRSELKMFFSLSASPSHPMRYAVEKNRLQPLSWGAPARVMLAHLRDEEVDEVIARAEPSPLDGRPLDAADLRKSLRKIRREGGLVTFGQRSPDSWGVAAPFFGADGEVMGSINITVPSFRYASHSAEALLALVRAGTWALTKQLGGPD